MSTRNPGKVISYINKEGEQQKSIAFDEDQRPSFYEFNRIFVKLINDDFSPKLDENGKRLCALINTNETNYKVIGFVD